MRGSKTQWTHWMILITVLLPFSWTPGLAGAPAPRPDTSGAHTPEHQLAALGKFRFESGETIDDLKVSYVTQGKLNEAKDNAILVMHHFFGDHHDHDFLIGAGKPLDTNKYFIVATDFLGNARLRTDLTTGPTNSGLKMRFPRITARDWVSADHKLVAEYLGIDHVVAAIGISVGAINAYQLAVSYPDFAKAIIPIAGTPRTNPQTQRLLRHMESVIALDSGWYGGMYNENPTTGIAVALMELVPWLYTYDWFAERLSSPEKVRATEKFWHNLFTVQFAQDARDIYYQLDGWAEFNVGDTAGFNGDTKAALSSIKAKALLIGFKDDMLFRREESLLAAEAVHNARYFEIQSQWGHAACCVDPKAAEIMGPEIARFLASIK
jgi:homoserine O-acetyltransferase/O-succinyltransferase